jgi:hypothetical protein
MIPNFVVSCVLAHNNGFLSVALSGIAQLEDRLNPRVHVNTHP